MLPNAHRYPIIALWAHPRSMSTATERIMRERGDCQVFHEPFLVYYYKHLAKRDLPMLNDDTAKPQSYEAIRGGLLSAGAKQPVFFKDMAYYVWPKLEADSTLCRRLTHVFLLRNPQRSLASYYKLDKDFALDEVGLEAQWRLYNFLHEELGINPLVVSAEAIATDPRSQLRTLWEYAGLDFTDHAFDWSPDTIPQDWRYVADWHGRAVASTGIHTDSRSASDVFNAVVETAPHLQTYLDHHQPFYEKLLTKVV